jgi:CRP/FNR family transcriptional regulator, cyclic AMP receptor protein
VASRPDTEFLRHVPLFKDVDEPTLRALWPRFRQRRLRKGEVLFRTGDPGHELFLIHSGSVVVSKPVTGRVEQVLRRMQAGEVFGEMSVFGDEQTRSATIQAETDAVLLGLHRDTLHQFIDSSPRDAAKFLLEMVRVSFKRLRDTSDLVAEVTRWGLEATGLDVEHK